jgi:hypothetical protein
VVLNGCYFEAQAKAIGQHIPYVIGMNQAIGDRAAIAFAVASTMPSVLDARLSLPTNWAVLQFDWKALPKT